VSGHHPDPVREFIRAFNEGDIDAFAATLHPEVEIHSMKGVRKGVDAARAWATKVGGGVQQTVVLDELWEEADRAVALVTRDWHWEEDGTKAGSDEMGWVFGLLDGEITSWRPFEDRAEALHEGGFTRS
jgi:ketosteroid isomerase-like protein